MVGLWEHDQGKHITSKGPPCHPLPPASLHLLKVHSSMNLSVSEVSICTIQSPRSSKTSTDTFGRISRSKRQCYLSVTNMLWLTKNWIHNGTHLRWGMSQMQWDFRARWVKVQIRARGGWQYRAGSYWDYFFHYWGLYINFDLIFNFSH